MSGFGHDVGDVDDGLLLKGVVEPLHLGKICSFAELGVRWRHCDGVDGGCGLDRKQC